MIKIISNFWNRRFVVVGWQSTACFVFCVWLSFEALLDLYSLWPGNWQITRSDGWRWWWCWGWCEYGMVDSIFYGQQDIIFCTGKESPPTHHITSFQSISWRTWSGQLNVIHRKNKFRPVSDISQRPQTKRSIDLDVTGNWRVEYIRMASAWVMSGIQLSHPEQGYIRVFVFFFAQIWWFYDILNKLTICVWGWQNEMTRNSIWI